jgi:polysaccharide pyruvyl transferase WcaK-like protein
MKAQSPEIEITHLDLAGRTSYGAGAGRRQIVVRATSKLPAYLRRATTAALLHAQVWQKLRHHYRQQLSGAGALVLGGGNLFADADLNFPIKIAALVRELRTQHIEWVAYGVGVSSEWSKLGKGMMRDVLESWPPHEVFVRDERSKANWDTLFAGARVPPAHVCVDPAVTAHEVFHPVLRFKCGQPVLGLNVMAHEELGLHSAREFASASALLGWWTELIVEARKAGFDVRLFTNGSPNDEQLMDKLRMRVQRAHGVEVFCWPAPTTPPALAAIVASCDLVAGHRMHAHIPAFSYGIPSAGFVWDRKLESFFESIGRHDSLLQPGAVSAKEAVEIFGRALRAGVDRRHWGEKMHTHSECIARLIDSVARIDKTEMTAAVEHLMIDELADIHG